AGVALHVLAVGVSEYGSEARVPRLGCADADARALADVLKAQERHDGRGLFHQVIVTTLLNQEATRKAIGDALHALKEKIKEHDLLFVLFSGHGERHESGHYYFLTHDFAAGNLEFRALPWFSLNQLLGQMPCRSVVVLDTCHSGAAGIRGDSDAALQAAV